LHARKRSGNPDDDWDRAVAYSKEVSRLSSEIHDVQVKISEWRRLRSRARHYHEKQIQSLERQIEIRESQKASQQEGLEDYRDRKEMHYRHLMCSYVLDGFYFGDQDKKLQVVKFCMGRDSLALVAARGQPRHFLKHKRHGHIAHHHHVDKAQEAANLDGGDRTLIALRRRTKALEAAARVLGLRHHCPHHRCSQSSDPHLQDLRQTLQKLEAEEASEQEEYYADKKRWRHERQELGAREDALGESVTDMHHERAHLRQQAWAEVKSKMCPVVNENYSVNDTAIVEHALDECDAPGDQ